MTDRQHSDTTFYTLHSIAVLYWQATSPSLSVLCSLNGLI